MIDPRSINKYDSFAKLTRYFKREEFACKCGCGFDTVDTFLIKILSDIRSHFKKPIIINSGCRCVEYNKTIGGADKSLHLVGKAADIRVNGVSAEEVCRYADRLLVHCGGLGEYLNFVHIDVRSGDPRRWSYPVEDITLE